MGLMEEHGWRHEKSQIKTTDETRPKPDESRYSILPMVLLKELQELVVVPQIQYIAVFGRKTSSQLRVFRNCGRSAKRSTTIRCGQCPCREMHWFFQPFKKKLAIECSREHCEQPKCMFNESCVVNDLGANTDQCRLISLSTTLFSLLRSFFFEASFLKGFPFSPFSQCLFFNLWKHLNTISFFEKLFVCALCC